MAMEFWTGWYDHWFNPNRSTLSANDFKAILEVILEQNSSLNMYMFMGGTSFGFMAGANWAAEKTPSYMADTTSYDYDAVLTEGGRYTEKYSITKELLAVCSLERNIRPVEPPEQPVVAAFAALQLREAVCLEGLRSQLEAESSSRLLSMEQLAVNEGSGQSHGIVWYRANVNVLKKSQLKIRGHVRDLALVIIDGQLITQKPDSPDVLQSFGYWAARDAVTSLPCSAGKYCLDILVENMGRVNYGEPHVLDFQRKGLYEGPVEVDGRPIQNWEIYPMEMKKDWINNLQGWKPTSGSTSLPTMFRGTLTVEQPTDTYLDMRQFTKGVVFVSGFNLGRYMSAGPIHTLYLPAPLLKSGENQIVVFEEFSTSTATINFSSVAISTAVSGDISEPSVPAVSP